MVDQIDAQERLEAVNTLITGCDAIALEIENSFAQFDATLDDSETKSKSLISELEGSKSEILSHSEKFQALLLEKLTEITEKTTGFEETIQQIIEALVNNAEELYAQIDGMDGAHSEIVDQINENVSHMQSIYEALTNNWVSALTEIEGLQEQTHDNMDQNVKSHSEARQSEQYDSKNQLSETLMEGFNNLVADGFQPHINDLSENLTGKLIPNFESMVDENKNLQEEGGSSFAALRTDTLDTMFGNAENLFNAVEGVMDVMTNTVDVTSSVADVTVQAMDMTNIGLNQLNDAVENVLGLLGGLSLD